MLTRKLELGPQETRLLFTLEAEGLEVFRYRDARRILGGTDDSTKGVLRRLRRKGRVQEIEKGKYLLVPSRAGVEGSWSQVPFLLVPQLIDEYYIGFWSALNHWGLTEQAPRTVFVATKKQKRPVQFGPTTFQFIRLAPRKFFGTTQSELAGDTFTISDREKTLVDCLDFPRYAGGVEEIAKAMWEGKDVLDYPRLRRYAKRQGTGAIQRRLGYLLEVLSLADDVQEEIRSTSFKGFIWFDPLGPRKRLGYSKSYGLILNRSEEEIMSWRGF